MLRFSAVIAVLLCLWGGANAQFLGFPPGAFSNKAALDPSSGGGGPTYTKVQFKTNASFSGTTVTVSPTAAFTLHNTAILAIAANPNTLTLAVADNGGNTWVLPAGGCQATGGGYKVAYAYALNLAASTPTITLTVTGGTITGATIWLEEWSGINTTSAADGCSAAYTAGAGSAGTPFNTGAFTPATNGDLIWAWGQGLGGGGVNVGAGFAYGTNDNTNTGWSSEFLTQSTAASITPNWTAITGCFDCVAVGAAFKH